VIAIPKSPRFQAAVAILSWPVALYLFDWAGFDWQRSFWGWVIFLAADAGMTSFVSAVVAIALLVVHRRRGR
jgi:hypothetical protein